jgi:hypothetical protein
MHEEIRHESDLTLDVAFAYSLNLPFFDDVQRLEPADRPPLRIEAEEFQTVSFAETRSPLVSITWERGCVVVEPGHRRPRRGILESDDILAKDSHKREARSRNLDSQSR